MHYYFRSYNIDFLFMNPWRNFLFSSPSIIYLMSKTAIFSISIIFCNPWFWVSTSIASMDCVSATISMFTDISLNLLLYSSHVSLLMIQHSYTFLSLPLDILIWQLVRNQEYLIQWNCPKHHVTFSQQSGVKEFKWRRTKFSGWGNESNVIMIR